MNSFSRSGCGLAFTPFLLAFAGFLNIVPGSGLAADDTAGSAERRLAEALREVAARGATLYNEGDAPGCCRLYEGALIAARALLDDRPELRKAVSRSLDSAQQSPEWEERAFLLRGALDKVRRGLKPAARIKLPEPTKVADLTLSGPERTLLDLTNKEREKEGLKPLRPNAKLFNAARAHSANMARQDKLAHVLDGKTPEERIGAAGYRGATWGENIAAGFPPAQAMDVWMNSEGHRANILNPAYTEVGIGIGRNENEVPFYTIVFGAPFRR